MAITGRIRRNAGLLVGVIAFAMVAFVFMDVFSGNSLFGGPDIQSYGTIDGKQLDNKDFDKRVEQGIENAKAQRQTKQLDENTTFQIKEEVWSEYLKEKLIQKECEELGISISSDELSDMVAGNNIHPLIQQVPGFADENTRQFDPNRVRQFVQAVNSGQVEAKDQEAWDGIVKGVRDIRLQEKYTNLLTKGLYTTNLEFKKNQEAKNKKANLSLVMLDFYNLPDSSINVSDEELEDYYKDHQKEFEQEDSRKVEYVVFEVNPTPEDSAFILENINELKKEFQNALSDSAFVDLKSDLPINGTFFKKDKLLSEVTDTLFNLDSAAIFGPYIEDGHYKITKISDKRAIADSAKVRHILVATQPQGGQPRTIQQANDIADSLINLLNTGQPFELLVAMNSDDAGSKLNAGVYDFFPEGQMVPSFNDSSFLGPIGKIMKVQTTYGFHILEVLDRKDFKPAIKISTVALSIDPSEETYNEIFQIANRFQGENRTHEAFDKSINEEGLSKRIAEVVKKTDPTLSNVPGSRQVVRWAFNDAEKGSVSEVNQVGQNYLVASVSAVREKGNADFESVKDEVKNEVLKAKKAEMLVKKFNDALKNSSDINQLASALNVEVRPAANVDFSASFVPVIGDEPAIIGTAFTMETNKMSKPIKGKRGVYVIQVDAFNSADSQGNIENERRQNQTLMQTQIQQQMLEALKAKNEVKDNRHLFF